MSIRQSVSTNPTNFGPQVNMYGAKRNLQEIHLNNILHHVRTQSWTPDLLKSIIKIPLAYNPVPLDSMAAAQDPMGNSIHNRASVARMESDFHGLRVFKALIVVHTIVQDQDTGNNLAMKENGSEELKFWMETVLHDCKHGQKELRGIQLH
jgi:hypothetical protein